MCGLFGVLAAPGQLLTTRDRRRFIHNARQARRRGSDASGLVAIRPNGEVEYIKSSMSVSDLLKNPATQKFLASHAVALFGHSRLETHGFSAEEKNNQPMVSPTWFVLHNGIVTNQTEVRQYFGVNNDEELPDSDSYSILLALENWDRRRDDESLEVAFGRLKGELTVIAGSTSGDVILYTNVGNLYLARSEDDTVVLGSEPRQIPAGHGDVGQLGAGVTILREAKSQTPGTVRRVAIGSANRHHTGALGLHLDSEVIPRKFSDLVLELDHRADEKVRNRRRCSVCVLPDTFPNIVFDESGVCSICRAFTLPRFPGIDAMRQEIETASPDGKRVLVCLSGGRDSCYVLHMMHDMGFEPIAYTYDWGMVTTAARENMARMCGQLGVEHILVSPNIQKNRDRVRHALVNWLRRPDVATLPILMAGDKPYFRFARIVSRERGNLPAIMADHHLETTGFKSMLAGALPSSNDTGGVEYRLSRASLLRMALRYGKSAVLNPPMARSIMVEGAVGFIDYYLREHTFVRPFMFVPWEEDEIETTLTKQYGWSKGSDDSLPAWRMGDATAPFYNLVYKLHLGMTEHDALRSNQIRYGLISRDEALKNLQSDNAANVLGLAGYLATAGLDVHQSIDAMESLLSKSSK